MDTIVTHVNVDLDAALSLAAARVFIPGAREAKVVFLPANWNGEMEGEILFLDMEAGGRGIKGELEEDGRIHSCFKSIVETYAPEDAQKILAPMVLYVDTQDMYGSAMEHLLPNIDWEMKEMLSSTNISAVLGSLKSFHNRNDKIICERMEEILVGRLRSGRSRLRGEAEADQIPLLGEGRVAVVLNARYTSTTGVLFGKHGVQVVIYQNDDGIGLIRRDSLDLRMDHPAFYEVVNQAGEGDEWFGHSAGFIFCRGSRKAPMESPSRVDPYILAHVAIKLLDSKSEHEKEKMEGVISLLKNSLLKF